MTCDYGSSASSVPQQASSTADASLTHATLPLWPRGVKLRRAAYAIGARTTSKRCVLGSRSRHSGSSLGRMPRHLWRLSSGRAAGLGSKRGNVVYSARSGSKEDDRKSSSAGAPAQTQQRKFQSQC